PAGTSDNANNDDAEPKKLVIEPTTTPQAGHSKATANLEITVSLKPGDTLTQVAKKYGVTTAGLLQ
ncbi:MAG TPA: hypothetical protein DDW50_21375, partial [Firmicutes bacterium]|nr:hypothetical protein [Bacillota bacterium]